MNLKSLSIVYYLGMAAVFAGVLLKLAGIEMSEWIFTAGVVPILAIRIYNRFVCIKERRRINSTLVLSAVMLAAAAALMIMGRNYWIIAILISAVIDFYASFRKL
jgi:hypothetical protein